jgi:LuxR family maltose regulon positive regulatory protein
VELAVPGQVIRPLVDLGPAIVRLLNQLDLDREGLQYAGRILDALRGDEQATTHPAVAQALPDPLSPRELEILSLYAGDLSNREIAERLFISTGTVKRHSHNIYGKLAVGSRREAVTKATALGLLDSG